MKVGVVFGGRSAEHDISIITGIMAVNASSIKHDVTPLYIDGDGKMRCGDYREVKDVGVKKSRLARFDYGGVYISKKFHPLDCVINACHGRVGEDGCLDGLLEFYDLTYTSPGVLASATGMDKWIFKQIMAENGIPVLPFFGLNRYDYCNLDYDIGVKAKALGFPLIVKPANLGSSIGITVCHDYKGLFEGLSLAFEWDNRVIVEKALTQFREINCAVLGIGDKIKVSETEEPYGFGDFLSFSDKYLKHGKEGRRMPAELSPAIEERIKELAKQTFKAIDCSGVSRIDFLLSGEDVYVNEINTIPGSLASYLFAPAEMGMSELIDELIETAVIKRERKNRLKYAYKSDVLWKSKGGKTGGQ